MTASSAACCSPSILLPDSSYYYLLLFMPPPIYFTCGIYHVDLTTTAHHATTAAPHRLRWRLPALLSRHARKRSRFSNIEALCCRVLFFLYSTFLLCASHNMANINSVDISRLKNGEINLGVGPLSSTYVQFPSDMCP